MQRLVFPLLLLLLFFISNVSAAHCTRAELHTTCLFDNWTLCLDPSRGWISNSPSPPISLISRTPWNNKVHNKCDAPFRAELVGSLPTFSRRISGNSILVCAWNDHFGHLLTQVLIPAAIASRRMNVSHVNVIADDRWPTNTFFGLMQLLSSQPVARLSFLRQLNETVCFEKMIVGLELTSPIVANQMDHRDSVHLTMTDLAAAREMLWQANRIRSPRQNAPCQITIVQRHYTRRISNAKELKNALSEAFPACPTRIVVFDDHPLRQQIIIASSTTILIVVPSTEAHFALFMPTGGLVAQIKHEHMWDVNQIICARAGYLRCITLPAKTIPSTEWNRHHHVQVDVAATTAALAL